MKVCILTWHYIDNYGGVLQCWALQKVLQGMGMEVKILDYTPKSRQSRLPWWRGWKLSGRGFFENLPRRFMRLTIGRSTERKFDRFRAERLNLSSPCCSAREVRRVLSPFDAVIVGSDQVWRFPDEKVYFLDFGSAYQGKKISYAACCGSDGEERYRSIAHLWQNMDAVSTRNGFSKKIVENVAGLKVSIVTDPTMLVDIDPLAEPVSNLPSKYIVTYIMGDEIEGGHHRVLDKIKEKIGDIPVIAIVASAQCPRFFSFAEKSFYQVSPEEWVYLLKQASFIYTDSFHASLYAIKHRKPFMAYYVEENRSGRFLDLIEQYGIAKCIADSADDAIAKLVSIPTSEELDKIDLLTSRHESESFSFLRDSLLSDIFNKGVIFS